jgi:hypothetical protein
LLKLLNCGLSPLFGYITKSLKDPAIPLQGVGCLWVLAGSLLAQISGQIHHHLKALCEKNSWTQMWLVITFEHQVFVSTIKALH